MLDPATQPREARAALADDTPLERVVRALLAAELDALLAEREGLEQDTDPEPLHRARVALRRTRTWLRQFRHELPSGPPDGHGDLARGIARLARRSGPLRDLDLLLEWLAGQAGSLGPQGAATLAALEREARDRRTRARSRWRRRWTSERTRELLARWRTLATTAGGERPVPAGPIVRERLARRQARLLRRGSRLHAGAPAADFHALRIECKKLRYLLDGFAGLFDGTEVTEVLNALRRLQGALGDANDAEVQRDGLVELGRTMRRPGEGPEPWLTIGRLWERAEARRLRARERFMKRFEAFRTGGASARLERLLQRGAR